MQRVWKPIKGYEGYYEINDIGEVRRMYKTKKPKILKQQIDLDGYPVVCLSVNNKKRNRKVSRLLAETFIENPNNYPVVNHKDGIKTNNIIDNLEWCSISYNTKHAYDKDLNKSSIHCTATNIETKEIFYFDSFTECAKYLNVCHSIITTYEKRGNLVLGKYKISRVHRL